MGREEALKSYGLKLKSSAVLLKVYLRRTTRLGFTPLNFTF